MATKKNSKKSSTSGSNASYNKTLIQIQKLANNSAQSIQKMVNASNKQQMTFNSAEAQKARDWQQAMSEKSHQMEVADLKKAGLNPVLSANNGGATSYTTSSASTQNDSGASATSGILSESLGAMTNLESARMQTEAQLKASRQQAEATRYAATTSARAQMFAAQQSAAASRYRADVDADIAKKNRANQRWITKNQNASTWAAFLDKQLRNFGVYGAAKTAVKNTFGGTGAKSMKQKFNFSNWKTMTKHNFKLTASGQSNANNILRSMGVAPTKRNTNNYVKASVFFDKKAFGQFIKDNPFVVRPGYR